MRTRLVPVAIVLVALTLGACNALKQIQDTITNLERLEFKLDSVDDFTLMGIRLADKKNISDFGIADGAKLAAAFARNEFPASFRLNVAAMNPNDGSGKTTASSATMSSFAWTLLIDNTETISGNIDEPISIPGTGKSTIIPLTMSLDLAKFFGERSYEKVLNLALAIGGVGGSPSRLTLRATPRISTPYGDIEYPNPISIVDTEFRGK